MKKKGAVCFLLLFVAAYLVSLSFAADGKEILMNKCGSCHRAGGGATTFAPTKWASVQWERFFAKNKHGAIKDISAQISEAEMSMVKDYLVKHAADSDQPESIGLR